jgi:hypothetical protein
MHTNPDATCQKIQGAPDNDRQRKPDSVRRPSHVLTLSVSHIPYRETNSFTKHQIIGWSIP